MYKQHIGEWAWANRYAMISCLANGDVAGAASELIATLQSVGTTTPATARTSADAVPRSLPVQRWRQRVRDSLFQTPLPGTEWHIRRLTRYPTTAPTASTQQMSQHVSYPETKNPLLEPQAPANQRHPSPKPNSGPSSQSASSIPSPTSRYFRTSTNSLLTCGSRNQSESGSIAVWLYV